MQSLHLHTFERSQIWILRSQLMARLRRYDLTHGETFLSGADSSESQLIQAVGSSERFLRRLRIAQSGRYLLTRVMRMRKRSDPRLRVAERTPQERTAAGSSIQADVHSIQARFR